LFVPANYSPTKKYPIILTLHGAGERGTDNASQLVNNIVTPWIRDSVQQKHPCFIVSPQCPPSLTWGNFDWSTGYYRIGATQ
jgi:predicted peptidase